MTKADTSLGKTKILFAASEALPFAATGGLGDVMGSLPKALAKNKDLDVRVIIPFYEDIPARFKEKMTQKASFSVSLAWRNQPCRVLSMVHDDVTFYFVENEYYFKRSGLYGYYDDGERFAYFSKAVPEVLKNLDFIPDIVHSNDWQTAMVNIYLKTVYRNDPTFKNVKTMFTIHNIEYQGRYDRIVLGDLFGLGEEYLPLMEYRESLNLVKGAIIASDAVGTVSPSYSEELRYSYFAHGLEEIILAHSDKMFGVLNGIDENFYNPKKDEALFANYGYNELDKKLENKVALQKIVGLTEAPDTPLVAIVSRMVESKGLDLIMCVMDDILKEKVQVVILGCGDNKYEDFFRWKGNRYPGKMASLITYDRDLSHKIYAGADLLLMPSNMEPCGLAQMIASRYGTVPVVRSIGGLRDSIKDYGQKDGNGFTFENYNAHEMLDTLNRGLALYENKEEWQALVGKIMRRDFSWRRPAEKYLKIYSQLLAKKKAGK